MVIGILSHGRIGPTAIRLRQLLLKASFHAIEHPDALLISSAILLVNRLEFIAFQMCHVKMMHGFRRLSTASIDTLDLIANVSIIVSLGKLRRSAV